HPPRGRMIYVYVLQSQAEPERYYVGVTEDLRARLKAHNSGKVSHTSKYKPWRVNTYIGFTDKDRAFAFEKYLKSRSGRAFAKKRL
ncbi:MAG TPA: GIY-YIG nuclease family protein, partial [Rhizomicrobium sp.]